MSSNPDRAASWPAFRATVGLRLLSNPAVFETPDTNYFDCFSSGSPRANATQEPYRAPTAPSAIAKHDRFARFTDSHPCP